MPAADISQVQVTFGNGIKREEYGPLKKAEVTITAIVDTGHDGVAALNYISKIAQDKVRELLTLQGQASAGVAEAPAEPATAENQADAGAAPGEPQRRKRRTQAEIAADAAAAAAAQSPPATETATSVDPTDAPIVTAETADTSEPVVDEWDVGAADAPTITDLELNHSCSETAGRTKKPLDVKALIGTFAPATDEFNVEKGGRKFTVNDIPQNQRADFIAKLKALT